MSTEKGSSVRSGSDGDHPDIARGLGLAVLTAIISGVAVFIAGYGVKEFASPAVYTTLRNTVVGLTFLAALLARPAWWQELRAVTLRQGVGLALLGILGGSVPFVLFFEGLKQAGPGEAAFIQKTLFLWVAVLAIPFLRERLGIGQLIALGLLLASQVVSGGAVALRLGRGETLVLIATLCWSVEVVLAKRLLATISNWLAATARMVVGAAILLGYLAGTGTIGSLGQLSLAQWVWVIGPGILLFGYVATWYAALKRAPATTVTCVLTAGAPLTATLSALAAGGLPHPDAVRGYVILIVAVALFTALSLRDALHRTRDVRDVVRGDA